MKYILQNNLLSPIDYFENFCYHTYKLPKTFFSTHPSVYHR